MTQSPLEARPDDDRINGSSLMPSMEETEDAVPSPTVRESSASSRTTEDHPTRLRAAVRINVADGSQVRASTTLNALPEDHTTTATKVRTRDIIKIFVDDADFMEVSPEQLDRVKSMHARMSEAARFSFNYNTLLLVASVLAGLGLVSNSGATIIASMLVSPIMGPVIGLAYGSTIRDWKLVRTSTITELISLLFCIAVGATTAAITGPTSLHEIWPTFEMVSRGTMTTFYVALPIAFFSGLGVAVSLLDEQTSSLVGVAISASLLPPAVNAGVLWVCQVFVENNVIPEIPDVPANLPGVPQPLPAPLPSNGTRYLEEDIGSNCEYDDVDCVAQLKYSTMGINSLFITLANIVLIWLSSMLMFRIKEVLPIKKSVFWSDLGVARKVFKKQAVLQRAQVTFETDSAEEAAEG